MPSTPMRLQAGFTQNRTFQPLGLIGQPDPSFYSTFFDDFVFFQGGRYTLTNTGNGAIAGTPADGGAALFTTNSSTPAGTDISSAQTDFACLQLATGLRWAFVTRLQVADATNPAVLCGLIQKTTTPFTVTDGVYFLKASGQTYPTLSVVSGSTVQGTVSLNGLAAFANNTNIDLGFCYDGKKDLLVYAGAGLMGGTPDQDRETLGPIARIQNVGLLTLSTAILAPTVAIQSGTASSKTLTLDFFYSAKER